jgi:hypothetical protein
VLEAAHVNGLQLVTTALVTGLMVFSRVGIYAIMAATALVYALLQFL